MAEGQVNAGHACVLFEAQDAFAFDPFVFVLLVKVLSLSSLLPVTSYFLSQYVTGFEPNDYGRAGSV